MRRARPSPLALLDPGRRARRLRRERVRLAATPAPPGTRRRRPPRLRRSRPCSPPASTSRSSRKARRGRQRRARNAELRGQEPPARGQRAHARARAPARPRPTMVGQVAAALPIEDIAGPTPRRPPAPSGRQPQDRAARESTGREPQAARQEARLANVTLDLNGCRSAWQVRKLSVGLRLAARSACIGPDGGCGGGWSEAK